MTRQQCEDSLVQLMKAAMTIYRAYNPDGDHLSMWAVNNSITVMDFVLDGDEKIYAYKHVDEV